MNTTTTNQIMTNNKGGVKTAEGKEISKYNAVRHGVLTRILLNHELDEAKIIQNKLLEEYQPQSITEELLIETLVIAYMRRQRACFQEINGIGVLSYTSTSSGAETFLRYITTSERQFYRALHELQRIQAIRNGFKPTSMAVDFIGANNSD
jgi:hypothetical protein